VSVEARPSIEIGITRVGECDDLELPSAATAQSAGFDLRARLDATRVLQPGERLLVPTGVAIALPEGYEAQVRPRSGLAIKHGVTLLNAPGTIDADYRGEIGVILIHHGQEALTIQRGDRIAQLVVQPVPAVSWRELESLPATQRGAGGFGHSGER